MAFNDALSGFTNASNTVFGAIRHRDEMEHRRNQLALQSRQLAEQTRLADQTHVLNQRKQDETERHALVDEKIRQRQVKVNEGMLGLQQDQAALKKETTALEGHIQLFDALEAEVGPENIAKDPRAAMSTVAAYKNSGLARRALAARLGIESEQLAGISMVPGTNEMTVQVKGDNGIETLKGPNNKPLVLDFKDAQNAIMVAGATVNKHSLAPISEAMTKAFGDADPDQVSAFGLQDPKLYESESPAAMDILNTDFNFNANPKLDAGVNMRPVQREEFSAKDIDPSNFSPDFAKIRQPSTLEYVARKDLKEYRRLEDQIAKVQENTSFSEQGRERAVQGIREKMAQIASKYEKAGAKGEVNADIIDRQIGLQADKITAPVVQQIEKQSEKLRFAPTHEKTLVEVGEGKTPDRKKALLSYLVMAKQMGITPDPDRATQIAQGDMMTDKQRDMLKLQIQATKDLAKIKAEALKGDREASEKAKEATLKYAATIVASKPDFGQRFRLPPDATTKDKTALAEAYIDRLVRSNPRATSAYGDNYQAVINQTIDQLNQHKETDGGYFDDPSNIQTEELRTTRAPQSKQPTLSEKGRAALIQAARNGDPTAVAMAKKLGIEI